MSCSPVCAGTVLFSITSFGVRDSFAIIRATLSIAERSASPVSVGGVPTQMKTTSASRTASAPSAVKRNRPSRTTLSSTLSRFGS